MICCGPDLKTGAVSVIVLASLNVTEALFPPIVAVVVVWNPLPRTVIAAPPAAGVLDGVTVPMPSGTLAS